MAGRGTRLPAGTSADPAATPAGDTAAIAAALRGAGPVLGIDAGGTGTRAALVADGVITRRLSGAPFNFLLSGDGVAPMAELVRAAALGGEAPTAAGIGVPGIAREPGSAGAFAAAVSEACGVPVRVASDVTVAWLGAFLGGPGIVVAAGTGSVAAGGRTSAGLRRAGGHGHLVGDEGGGYWIGKTALRAALAAAEGTGPPTRLAGELAEAAGGSLDELLLRAQRSPAERSVLAALAPVAGGCAAGPDPDPVAAAIVAEAAGALAALAEALRQRLGDLPVAGAGGVFAIAPLWRAFERATGAVRPLAPPEIGAALLAADGCP